MLITPVGMIKPEMGTTALLSGQGSFDDHLSYMEHPF
jgi:hypothetical protein